MTRALVILDSQQDYFPGGAHPLVGPNEAADAADTADAQVVSNREVIVRSEAIR
jgi:hypothetical protein